MTTKLAAVPSVHFSSASNEWATDPKLFAKLDEAFHFDLDVAATCDNTLCERYLYAAHSDPWITQSWCWANPPYSRELPPFIARGLEQLEAGRRSVFLVPARTDTAWFASVTHLPIFFFRGRLKFGGVKNSAPFPNCLIFMGNPTQAQREHISRSFRGWWHG